ncbi:hypothetical protein AHAS_Ahas01G0072800 [Arachis hypogaea]|uniref:Protein FAR1-RELATED SEQUENCE n=1 Tax=Arachis hypogaea TaxID=3818 RepID=A0A445EUU3_ARAHY|nr:hypothetical protein Ahy_A01g003990 [Arachis hypogaea]
MGFSKKDTYNYVDQSKRPKIVDGNSNAAIVYLEGKAVADPMSISRYNLTKDNMLANMFWVDGGSRTDYQFFGDVLAFDSIIRLLLFFCKNSIKSNRMLPKIIRISHDSK